MVKEIDDVIEWLNNLSDKDLAEAKPIIEKYLLRDAECEEQYGDKAVYVTKLFPTNEQAAKIERTFIVCQNLYNHFLYRRKEYYKLNGESLYLGDIMKELTKMRKENIDNNINDVAYEVLSVMLYQQDKEYYSTLKSKHKPPEKKDDVIDFCTCSAKFSPTGVKVPKIGMIKTLKNIPFSSGDHLVSAKVFKGNDNKYYVKAIIKHGGEKNKDTSK